MISINVNKFNNLTELLDKTVITTYTPKNKIDKTFSFQYRCQNEPLSIIDSLLFEKNFIIKDSDVYVFRTSYKYYSFENKPEIIYSLKLYIDDKSKINEVEK